MYKGGETGLDRRKDAKNFLTKFDNGLLRSGRET